MFRSFAQTIAYYSALQHEARSITEDAAARSGAFPDLRLGAWGTRAELAWNASWRPAIALPQHGGWDWPALLGRRWRRPEAFRLSIWSGSVLCGLAVGHPSATSRLSRVRQTISVDFVEGAPFAHPLRGSIALLTFTYAEAYGRVLGATRMRLVEPLPEVVGLYEEMGFSTVFEGGRPIYCERRI